MDKVYIYTLVREDYYTGERGKRAKKYYASTPALKVGGLYAHLGKGYPGFQRVLRVQEKDIRF